MSIEIKPLEIQQEKNVWKRLLKSKHLRRTLLYMAVGAMVSFGISFVGEGMELSSMAINEIFQSVIIGAFMGFFITNSPCARGRC